MWEITHIWKAFNLKHDEHEHNKVNVMQHKINDYLLLFSFFSDAAQM